MYKIDESAFRSLDRYEGVPEHYRRIEVQVTPDGGGPTFWEIFHGENIVLVDRQLRIRGYFPATPEGVDRLVEAIGRVVNGA